MILLEMPLGGSGKGGKGDWGGGLIYCNLVLRSDIDSWIAGMIREKRRKENMNR
jgi:hypothetical protein